MFEVKRILFSLLLLATLHGFADPVTIPDEIKDGGRVWIDFNSKELIQVLPGATLNDAAELAGTIFKTYLRPNVESGCVTPRDIALLNFCYQAFALQVQKCCRAFEQEMGRSEVAEKSDVIFYGSDVEKLQARSIQNRLSDLPFRLDGKSQSFCKLYSKDDAALLFCDANKIHDVLWAARNKDKVEVLALDPKEYGDYPRLHWMCGWVSTVGVMYYGACGATLGWCVGTLLSTTAIAACVPGPGWIVCAGCAGVAGVASGVAWWMVENKKETQWLNAVKLNNQKIEAYLDRVGNRKSYLDEVIEDHEGLYQRSYLGLVKIIMLIDFWKKNGWKGWQISAKTRNEFDAGAIKVRDWAENELSRMEDACINYPLMVDLMEASSVCLYLNYLDVKNISRTTEEKDKIRQTYLENAETVADVCSRLSQYSTGRIAHDHIIAYEGFFEQCYATNRVGLIKVQKKKEVEEYLENNAAMFANEDVDLVRKGHVNFPSGCEYTTIVDDCNRLDSNSLLLEIVNAKIGVERVESWRREAKGNIQDLWLYPSWSKEVSSAILPEGTEEINDIIFEFFPENSIAKDLSPKNANANRVRLLFDAVVAGDSELVGLASLKEVFDSADTIDEVKKAIIKEIGRRKLGDLKKEIEGNHGRVEDMVGRWIDVAVLDGTSDKLGCSKLSVRDVAARMKNEILPMWRKIELCERKPWWKFW